MTGPIDDDESAPIPRTSKLFKMLACMSMFLPSFPSYRPGKPTGNETLPAHMQEEIIAKAQARRERRAKERELQRLKSK
jgi:hypothetical protein